MAAERGHEAEHGQTSGDNKPRGGRFRLDSQPDQQHSRRTARHGHDLLPACLGREHLGGQTDQPGKPGQGDGLHGQRQQLPLGKLRHQQKSQRHQEHGRDQQAAGGPLQLPTMVGVESDPEDGRAGGHHDQEREVMNLLERIPKAQHQGDRRADDQQPAKDLSPADIAIFHKGVEHLGPRSLGTRWRFRLCRGRRLRLGRLRLCRERRRRLDLLLQSRKRLCRNGRLCGNRRLCGSDRRRLFNHFGVNRALRFRRLHQIAPVALQTGQQVFHNLWLQRTLLAEPTELTTGGLQIGKFLGQGTGHRATAPVATLGRREGRSLATGTRLLIRWPERLAREDLVQNRTETVDRQANDRQHEQNDHQDHQFVGHGRTSFSTETVFERRLNGWPWQGSF